MYDEGLECTYICDTKDCCSTLNLRKHAKSCWGEEVVKAADDARNADEVRTKIVPNSAIAVDFDQT